MKQSRSSGGLSRLLVSLAILATALLVFAYRQQLVDQFTVWQFKPSEDIVQIANRATLNEKGKFYLYASKPVVQERQAFNASCNTASSEQTAVLGCYVLRNIYIFNVTDQRLDGIREVTTAHEMLHAVYDRMSTAERTKIDGLVNAEAAKITDPSFISLLKEYDKTEPGERLNELHSIIGTQIPDINPELESYYAQYFTDRVALVKLYEKYQQVFADISVQQDALVRELDLLNQEITAETSSYNQEATTLNNDIEIFNRRATSGGFATQAGFNAERNSLTARQQELQQIKSSINAKIARYNERRQQLVVINAQAEALNRNINSNLSPVPSI